MSAPVMTAEELAAIEARANAATPGPWICAEGADPDYEVFAERGRHGTSMYPVAERVDEHDAAFIAAAREDVPRLLAALAHMTAVAEAERALRVATESLFMGGGGRAARKECDRLDDVLRALGVEP